MIKSGDKVELGERAWALWVEGEGEGVVKSRSSGHGEQGDGCFLINNSLLNINSHLFTRLLNPNLLRVATLYHLAPQGDWGKETADT